MPNSLPFRKIASILDIKELQAIMQSFTDLTHMVAALLDLDGNVLIATGWQAVCTRFHRKHPEAAKRCTESDLYLAKNLKPGEHVEYRCKNGLWDVATPLFVDGEHLGNVYTGQFFYDDVPLNEEFFITQADVFGFDRLEYLNAVQSVPRFNRETVRKAIGFLVQLTEYMSRLGSINMKLEEEIEQRREAEKNALENQLLVQSVIRAIPDLVWLKDLQGVYISCNKRFERLFNATEKEIVGKSDYDFVSKQQADSFRKYDQRAIIHNTPSVNEELLTFADDGHTELVETIKTPIFDSEGRVFGVLGIARDISRRKQTENDLRYKEILLEEMGRIAKIGAWEFKPQTGEGTWTDEVARIHDLDPSEKTSLPKGLAYYKGSSKIVIEKAVQDAVILGKPYDLELELISAKNVEKWVHTVGHPVVEDGKVVLVRGSFQDITDRKRTDLELETFRRHLEELVSERTTQLEAANKELEAFSYSVSHDLRAPLRAVDGYTRILSEDYGALLDDEGRRVCGIISDSAREMGRLIDDLLAFSRVGRSAMKPSPVDMATMANSIFFEFITEIERQRIDWRVGPLPHAVADPMLMRQVWMNLLTNAVKFTSKKERAIIEVMSHQETDDIIYCVRDNGVGFDMRYADKLFGVFQRLHSMKEFPGTGVGLAIVQRIVHRHGGRVWATGEIDSGATFCFSLKKTGSDSSSEFKKGE